MRETLYAIIATMTGGYSMKTDPKEDFRKLALSYPGVIESISYGTPSFKIKNKLLARFHEDVSLLVLRMDFETRDFLLQVNSETFYITDHYKNYPFVLVKLYAVDFIELEGHFRRVWKSNVSKRLLKEFENKLNVIQEGNNSR